MHTDGWDERDAKAQITGAASRSVLATASVMEPFPAVVEPTSDAREDAPTGIVA